MGYISRPQISNLLFSLLLSYYHPNDWFISEKDNELLKGVFKSLRLLASSVRLVAQDRKDFRACHDIAKLLDEGLERGTVLLV